MGALGQSIYAFCGIWLHPLKHPLGGLGPFSPERWVLLLHISADGGGGEVKTRSRETVDFLLGKLRLFKLLCLLICESQPLLLY